VPSGKQRSLRFFVFVSRAERKSTHEESRGLSCLDFVTEGITEGVTDDRQFDILIGTMYAKPKNAK
jgi:hypothetical protein